MYTLASFLFVLTPSMCCAQQSDLPNVVLIVSDDQGFTDFGFMGHPIVQTPNLDALVEESAFFPNGYVTSSLCRPSLVSLMTGLFPHQHLVHFNDPPDKNNRQQAEQFIRNVGTIPRWLAEKQYSSFQTGKFWEGNYRNAGFTAGMAHGDPRRGGRHGDEGLKIGREGMEPIFEFIEANGKSPFFLWYAPFMPHTPYTSPAKYVDLYKDKGLHPRVVQYYAMCTWFDDTVGQLIEFLDSRGLSDNTLIAFVVDNGWITNTESNRPPFAPKSKRSPFEMGIRTPMFFRWKGKIAPAKHADLVSSIDLAPTILAACGLSDKAKDLPGLNLLPLCQGETQSLPRNAVFSEVFEHDASSFDEPAKHLLYRVVRTGSWKLIDAHNPQENDLLFQLANDPSENENLAATNPEKAAQLRKLLDQWWTPEQ